jgi:hypothetical protein
MLAGVALVEGDESLSEAADLVPKAVEHDLRAGLGRLAGAFINRGWQKLRSLITPTIEISEYVFHFHDVHLLAPLENGGQRRSDSATPAAEATWSSNLYSKDGAGIGRRDCVTRRIG